MTARTANADRTNHGGSTGSGGAGATPAPPLCETDREPLIDIVLTPKQEETLDTTDGLTAGYPSADGTGVRSFRDYLTRHARVPLRGGDYGPFSFAGREPLDFIVSWIDKILANCMAPRGLEQKAASVPAAATEIDGVTFPAGALKGATLAVGGGAQWGKTVLVLNLQAYLTFVEFVNFGYYTPDQDLLARIVDTKFRPDVLDQQPWMAGRISLGKAENASGRAVNRKNSYSVTAGRRKAFGHFCAMHKPPTTISLDAAALDEVDDIPAKNLGYVDGRMTASPLQLRFEIGTQRIAGAGQNARLKAGSFHVKMVPCPQCGKDWNLEENFPRIIRVSNSAIRNPQSAMSLTPEMGHQREARYYLACPECGAELDRDAGRWVANNPERIKAAHFSIRVSQLNISAIPLSEIVGAWYAAMSDPAGDALVAFYCDRIAIPNAGTAQPITQAVLDRARGTAGKSEDRNPKSDSGFGSRISDFPAYPMALVTGSHPRYAGMDLGPRCWFWCDEVRDEVTSACVWAELIASGHAPTRVPMLMEALGIECLFLDAGGEPDLTKRLVLALNKIESYTPPVLPRAELLKMHLSFPSASIPHAPSTLTWDGVQGRWHGLRAAAVLFVAGAAKGIEQTIGFTQEGKIYPLIKCNRSESIQTAVNDFLTPEEGVLEVIRSTEHGARSSLRSRPRARLPINYPGAGVSRTVLDGHLLNLRKERDTRTGVEDWIDGVENHLGLAKTYARLAEIVRGLSRPQRFVAQRIERSVWHETANHGKGASI
jgi:Phage terminase large subunit (GpA)